MKEQRKLIYGKNPVLEALHTPSITIEKVFFQKGIRGPAEIEIRQACKEGEVPLKIVPKYKLDKFQKDHQGVLAIISPVPFIDLSAVIMKSFEEGRDPLILVCDQVTDVRNIGALARTALLMDVDALVFPPENSAGLTPEAIKSSAGALLKMPLSRMKVQKALESCRKYGVRVLGLDGKANSLISDVELSGPLCLVLGSEDEGLRPHVLRLVDEAVRLPQNDKLDSYNVSVAGSMAIYEVWRQRLK